MIKPRIVPDLFHAIYLYTEFEDYFTFYSLNKKCNDIMLNHNIIYQYNNGQLTQLEFINYIPLDPEHVMLCALLRSQDKFIRKLFSRVYKTLFSKHIQKYKTDMIKDYIGFIGIFEEKKYFIIKASNEYEAIYKFVGTLEYFMDEIIYCLIEYDSIETDWNKILDRVHEEFTHEESTRYMRLVAFNCI
jgi:hypothetical protein